MLRNKEDKNNARPTAPPTQHRRRLDFERDGLAGTIGWSTLDEDEADRLAADIERLLVDRVLADLRRPSK